ncbi:MAG: UDP-N-acetylmuramate dehydrogenase [Gammaproteobacteria bacterium]|nr:UDP-N-acetylmuramate dehydrogenase [Gammaproteobacteria bacterium]
MRGTLLHDEPMSAHTSWRTGGTADRFFVPADIDDLSTYLSQMDSLEKIYWVGLGSNLLVRDGGIRGTVISVTAVLDDMKLHGAEIETGAGLTCAKAARFAAKNNLSGAEFLAGIPGTIGGALAMNAGAFGGEIWDLVTSVKTIDRTGKIFNREVENFEVNYRSVKSPKNEYFVSARLLLKQGVTGTAKSNIRDLLSQRAESQPIGAHSCGSVFRNPEGDFAARLIEECGLKGYRKGDAEVSTKHANFIINSGSASAEDIETLIYLVQDKVEKKFNVRLETEVCIVGEIV